MRLTAAGFGDVVLPPQTRRRVVAARRERLDERGCARTASTPRGDGPLGLGHTDPLWYYSLRYASLSDKPLDNVELIITAPQDAQSMRIHANPAASLTIAGSEPEQGWIKASGQRLVASVKSPASTPRC